MFKGWCQAASHQVGKVPSIPPDSGRRGLRECWAWADLPAEGVRRNTPHLSGLRGCGVLTNPLFQTRLSFYAALFPYTLPSRLGRKSTRIFPQSTLVPSTPRAVKAMIHPPFICFEDLPWQPLSWSGCFPGPLKFYSNRKTLVPRRHVCSTGIESLGHLGFWMMLCGLAFGFRWLFLPLPPALAMGNAYIPE